MSYPLIIFGAGASHDYSIMGNPIAPLTNELAGDKYLPPDLLERYEGVGHLLSDVVGKVNGVHSFEQVLTDTKEEMWGSEKLQAHFVALEFFLKDLFKKISTGEEQEERLMHQINNYRSILNRIDTYCDGKACVVTFNYDTLFERNIPRGQPKAIKDYIGKDLKIFKLHGSHDWAYIHRIEGLGLWEEDFASSFEYCVKRPAFLEKIKEDTNNHLPFHEEEVLNSSQGSEFAQFPALAIPLNNKDRYVCPEQHIKALCAELSKIDRILIVGWKAGDPLLLETLKENLSPYGYKLCVVSKTIEEAREIIKTVQKSLKIHEGSTEAIGGGFSGFMTSGHDRAFFQ